MRPEKTGVQQPSAPRNDGDFPMAEWIDHDPIPSEKTVAETVLLPERIVREPGLDRFGHAKGVLPRSPRTDAPDFADMHSTAISNCPRECRERHFSHNHALDDPYIERTSREARPFLRSAGLHPRDAPDTGGGPRLPGDLSGRSAPASGTGRRLSRPREDGACMGHGRRMILVDRADVEGSGAVLPMPPRPLDRAHNEREP